MTGALATVDVQNFASHERGVFQKQDRVDDILNFAHASDRMQLRKELMCLGSVHRRLHNAGSYGVHPQGSGFVNDDGEEIAKDQLPAYLVQYIKGAKDGGAEWGWEFKLGANS